MGLLKKEKSDRQRDVEVLKDRVDNERKEMQILIDKDRDDTNKKLKEEHDQRRIEQMEFAPDSKPGYVLGFPKMCQCLCYGTAHKI